MQPAQDDRDETDPHSQLRDRSAPRRAADSPVEPVDEQDLEHDVDRISEDHDDERRLEIRDPAQIALPAEREKSRGQPDRCDAEVGHGVGRGSVLAAHEVDERLGQCCDERRDDDSEREGEPDGLRTQPPRSRRLARSTCASDLRGRSVLEEVEDRKDGAQDGGGDPERGELWPPEVPYDRRVDEEVERLGGERSERRERQTQDLPVVLGANSHAVAAASMVASYAATWSATMCSGEKRSSISRRSTAGSSLSASSRTAGSSISR